MGDVYCSSITLLFIHLKLEIVLAILVSNEWKIRTNNSAELGFDFLSNDLPDLDCFFLITRISQSVVTLQLIM